MDDLHIIRVMLQIKMIDLYYNRTGCRFLESATIKGMFRQAPREDEKTLQVLLSAPFRKDEIAATKVLDVKTPIDAILKDGHVFVADLSLILTFFHEHNTEIQRTVSDTHRWKDFIDYLSGIQSDVRTLLEE